jgi:photosystem II stability/assembly factor-like uncharacterized protein
MKNSYSFLIVAILFLTFSFTVQTQAQWQEQTSPTANALSSVSIVDNSVAWIAGYGGTVLRTTDGGANWMSVGGGALGTDDLYNIFAIDGQTALCTNSPSATNIYRTSDGGTTWTQVLSVAGGFMDAIWMFDSNNGIAYGDPVGGNWELYNTTDGGVTWTAAPNLAQAGSEAGWNNAMYVSGSDIYFGTNNTQIYYSSDSGNSWTPQTTTGEINSYAVWFNNSNMGLMGGSTGGLDATTNAGTTWSPITSPGTAASGGITGINNQWWVAQQASPGVIYYSSDNGASWSTQYTSPTSGAYYHIAKSRNGNWALAVRSDGGISSYMITVPVELTSFTASTNNMGQAVLNWQTATETNNRMFEIERKTSDNGYSTIGFVNGAGTSTETHSYSFVDKNVNAGSYTYRLKQIDFNGNFEYSNEVEISVTGRMTFDLAQNFPNPFNPTTNITYNVPQSGNVTLAVFNTLGQQVALLENGVVTAGSHTATFDAKQLPSGAYFYKLQEGNSVMVKKMLLLK